MRSLDAGLHTATMPQETVVAVGPSGNERPCLLEWERLAPHRLYRLTARLEGLDDVMTESSDCFRALQEVRSRLEETGLKLCCNGARTDAWASGMQRDMGEGLVCYLLSLPRQAGRPQTVSIFGSAPVDSVGTVAEQEVHYQRWAASSVATT